VETLNSIIAQIPAYITALLAILGGVWSILTALGGILPDPYGAWCRKAGSDVVVLANWLRGVSGGGK